jgi:hypothetical protein
MKNLYLSAILIFLYSCTQLTPEEKMIKDTLEKRVEIGMFESIWQGEREIPFGEFRNRYPYISLVYLEDGCLPCYPKFIEWQTRMDTLDLHDNFTVLFIILGISYERFMDNLHESEPEYEQADDQFHVVMDPDYRFLDNNPDIDRWVIDKSMLIDAGDKIKLIGPPFASPRMSELFYSICEQ